MEGKEEEEILKEEIIEEDYKEEGWEKKGKQIKKNTLQYIGESRRRTNCQVEEKMNK